MIKLGFWKNGFSSVWDLKNRIFRVKILKYLKKWSVLAMENPWILEFGGLGWNAMVFELQIFFKVGRWIFLLLLLSKFSKKWQHVGANDKLWGMRRGEGILIGFRATNATCQHYIQPRMWPYCIFMFSSHSPFWKQVEDTHNLQNEHPWIEGGGLGWLACSKRQTWWLLHAP